MTAKMVSRLNGCKNRIRKFNEHDNGPLENVSYALCRIDGARINPEVKKEKRATRS